MRSVCRVLGIAVSVWMPFMVAQAKETDRLMEEIAERIATVQSLDRRFVARTKIVAHGTEHEDVQETRFAFQRPDRLLIQMGDRAKLVSDGQEVFLINIARERFMRWPLVGSLEDTLAQNSVGLIKRFSLVTEALIATNPAVRLKEFQEMLVGTLPDEDVDGSLCWVVVYERSPGKDADTPSTMMWIDQKYGLVRRIEYQGTGVTSQTRGDVRIVSMLVEGKEPRVNEALDDALFSFTPGEDSREVATTEELWARDDREGALPFGAFPGLSRFELSGKPAPDFELELLDGSTFRLADHREKIVVLDFWATWCAPCVRALPDIRALDVDFRERGVKVVGISRDRAGHEDRVREMVEDKELAYPIGIDVSDISRQYAVRGIPCVVVIDREGIVQGRKVGFSTAGMRALREDLERLLVGEALESAAPMTEEEIEQHRAQRLQRRVLPRTTFSEEHFKVVWQSETETGEPALGIGGRMHVHAPPRHFAVQSGDRAVVIRAEDGKALWGLDLAPLTLTDMARENRSMAHLSHPDGGVMVVLQQFLREERDGDRTMLRSTNVTMRAYDAAGDALWVRDFGPNLYFRQLDALPISRDEEVAFVAFWNRLLLINAQGQELLDQPIGTTDRVDVVWDQAQARVLFYVTGSVNACYELILPVPDPDP